MRHLLLLMLCLPGMAFAVECESDSDCGENERCQRMDIAIGAPCSIDSDGNEDCPEPAEPEPGECVPGPIPCESDAECPGISSCAEDPLGLMDVQDCAPAEDGEEVDCEPVTTQSEPTSFCQFVPESCTETSDCAEGLTCTPTDAGCVDSEPAVDCAEGQDCPEPETEQEGCGAIDDAAYCVPEIIECEADSECPTDWSCETLVTSRGCGSSSTPIDGETTEPSMSGGSSGSSGSSNGSEGVPQPEREDDDEGDAEDSEQSEGGGAPPQMQERDPQESDVVEEEECEEVTVSWCMPAGYEHYFDGAGSASTETSVPLENSNPDNDDARATGEGAEPGTQASGDVAPTDESDSGCDCSTATHTGLNSVWALLLLCVGFRRRSTTTN
jgi:hypothetical protein